MKVLRTYYCDLFTLCDSGNTCFLLKYDSGKLHLELRNTNHESLNRTLIKNGQVLFFVFVLILFLFFWFMSIIIIFIFYFVWLVGYYTWTARLLLVISMFFTHIVILLKIYYVISDEQKYISLVVVVVVVVLLFCHFNKIMKGFGISFSHWHWAKTCQKFLLCSILVFDQISFWWYLEFKRNMLKCNFQYAAVPMMTSQISKSGFHENLKIEISCEQNVILFSNTKIH